MDGYQQLENTKVQLMAQLKHLSEQMRQVAEVADQYHQIVATVPFGQAVPSLPLISPGLGRKRKALEGDDGKKTRRKRDPDMPKRPASAYLFYQNEVRGAVKQAYPTKPHHELLGIISVQWNQMSDDEKRPYEEKQRAAKAIYDGEMAEWNVKHGIVPRDTAAARKPAPIVVDPTPVVKVVAPVTASSEASEESEAESAESEKHEDEEEDEESEEEEEAPPPPKRVSKPPSSKSQPAPTPAKAKKERKVKA